ncbi:RNA 2',3'-cyclic phosphodiesterase [Brevundimonas subvibrioides]|uniref:RNA 2',3'-cyclic phosphodiesterase n=1 Tax=Brevundimonas subvibrioides (strain ATCC 15264 / DSM 4735 / LMG 14903 / NBRC 16000 / CB 81) TaxID=633149 RepID=D9QKL9_BRESC|nr:RNA 2',3'-cyclic phosphodiesterase [Brevundimonas subvibrioides]ADK99844.1 2'-5' RNA ligase [Brevundimonas subvibrioides ATCC 15264]
MLRLFTALPVPFDVAETLARRQTGLPGAKWRTPEQLHVTLAFFGEVDERRADDLAAELARIPPGAFDIELKGVGAFGDAHRSHTLWAGVEPGERLTVLAGRCRAAAERAGVRMEPRVYRPHLTLAYLKTQTNPDRIGAWITGHNLLHSPPIRVDRFGLYSSVLSDGGSHYELEREYPL